MKKLLAAAALTAALVVPGMAQAAEEQSPNQGALHLSGGWANVTQYNFRGYNIEDSGFITQPWATLTAEVYESEEAVISASLGTWNSIQGNAQGPGHGSWYEQDVNASVDVKMGSFIVSGLYTLYTSPDNYFQDIQEFGAKVAWDDEKTMKDAGLFKMSPYAAWYIETQDKNGSQEQYFELGIAPEFTLEEMPLGFAVPVVAGFSTNGYYSDDKGDDELFGFLSVGLEAKYYITKASYKYGAWTTTLGGYYIWQYADSVQASNNGDDYALVAALKTGFTY